MNEIHKRLGVHVLPMIGVLACLLGFYWPTWQSLHEVWAQFDQSYSHGYLIAAVVGYWLIKSTIQMGDAPKPRFLGAVFILLCSSVWLFGDTTQTKVLAQLAIPVVLWTSLLTIYGYQYSLRIAPLILIFLFCIPLWDIFTPLLRSITTVVVQFGVSLLGIPAYFDGYKIEVPAGVIEIASSCAGLNYFLMANAFAAIYSYQHKLTIKQFVVCLSIATALALLGNWIRVYILVLVGYYSNMTHSLMHSHANFGWILFGIVLVPLFYLFGRLVATGSMPESVGEDRNQKCEGVVNGKAIAMVSALAFMCMALAPVGVGLSSGVESNTHYTISTKDEGALSEYSPLEWKPEFEGSDGHYTWRGDVGSQPGQLQVLLYTHQKQGKELIYYKNRLAPEHKLEHLNEAFTLNDVPINTSKVRSGRSNLLVLWTYNIGGRYTTSPLKAKWYQFIGVLSGDRYAALVALSLYCESDCTAEVQQVSAEQAQVARVFTELKIHQ